MTVGENSTEGLEAAGAPRGATFTIVLFDWLPFRPQYSFFTRRSSSLLLQDEVLSHYLCRPLRRGLGRSHRDEQGLL